MTPPPRSAPLEPSALLGKYEIIRLLSIGGMGELYLARSEGIEGFEKQVALKRILPQFASDPHFERMLLEEARLMATLHHPNIVQVYDVDRVDGSTFFTMEYVHGASLYGVLRAAAKQKRGLSLGTALWIASNVAAGLHYAHEKRRPDGTTLGLIHRDVSPGNIMISHEGGVKLVDFGVAMAIARSVRTAPGSIKGSVRYMSPEQCLGEALDRRSDVFALGIVLFELTTGTRWIRERDDHLALQRMLNEPLPRPSERRRNYPEPLERIVERALAKNPADRFQIAEELQLALEDFGRENKLATSSVHLARTMTQLFGTSEDARAGEPVTSSHSETSHSASRRPRSTLSMTLVPPTEPMTAEDRAHALQSSAGAVQPTGTENAHRSARVRPNHLTGTLSSGTPPGDKPEPADRARFAWLPVVTAVAALALAAWWWFPRQSEPVEPVLSERTGASVTNQPHDVRGDDAVPTAMPAMTRSLVAEQRPAAEPSRESVATVGPTPALSRSDVSRPVRPEGQPPREMEPSPRDSESPPPRSTPSQKKESNPKPSPTSGLPPRGSFPAPPRSPRSASSWDLDSPLPPM